MTCAARVLLSISLITAVVASALPSAAADQPAQPKASYAVVVKRSTAEDRQWQHVVAALKEKHNASVITHDASVDESLDALKQLLPRFTCFVAKPEEAGREFVAQVHQLTRKLDEDPYTDTFWGILTGYDADNALAIASHSEPLIVKKVASGTEFATEMVTEGQWYDELVKNKRVKKEPGGKAEELKGPDDTTKPLVDLLNSYKADLMITSGHATERDWQIGFRFRSGQFRCADGRLYGLDTQKAKHPIDSPNPKVYMPIGNCLMGHIQDRDSMALAWMNSAGVRQMIGYTVNTWYGYAGWGCLDYFVEQPGRYTFAEAFHANHHALIHRLETYFPGPVARAQIPPGSRPRIVGLELSDEVLAKGLRPSDAAGLLYDRDVVAFYGDPAWSARMADRPRAYDQQLKIDGKVYTFTIHPRRGADSFQPINTNGSQRGWRPIVQFLPHRIRDAEILAGEDLHPVVPDDFILVPNPRECDPDREYVIRFQAEELASGESPPQKPVAAVDE
jgi:zinc protease